MNWLYIGIGAVVLIIIIVIIVIRKHATGASGGTNATTVQNGPGSSQGAQPLRIISAQYVWPGDSSSNAASKDVTGVLQGLIVNNQLDLNSQQSPLYYDQFFGDIAPNKGPKQLRVDYEIGGTEQHITVTEDNELKLNM